MSKNCFKKQTMLKKGHIMFKNVKICFKMSKIVNKCFKMF